MNHWNIELPLLSEQRAEFNSESLFKQEVTAIHSGKLGDIIYALPTCRALGINHLILNSYTPAGDPLRVFTLESARQIVSLLLTQPYINKVSLTQLPLPLEQLQKPIAGIHYNLDQFRNVAKHHLGYRYSDIDPQVELFSEQAPVHLAQMFGSAYGLRIDLEEPWLQIPPSPTTKGKIVVSLTQRWRSFPDSYWNGLLEELPNIVFIGVPSDFNTPHEFIQAHDHRELASLIAGADLFLGTVSFPYAIAEALKIPRFVEICHHTLNVFPVGNNGQVLPIDLIEARKKLSIILKDKIKKKYDLKTKSLRRCPKTFYLNQKLKLTKKLLLNKRRSLSALRKGKEFFHLTFSRMSA